MNEHRWKDNLSPSLSIWIYRAPREDISEIVFVLFTVKLLTGIVKTGENLAKKKNLNVSYVLQIKQIII